MTDSSGFRICESNFANFEDLKILSHLPKKFHETFVSVCKLSHLPLPARVVQPRSQRTATAVTEPSGWCPLAPVLLSTKEHKVLSTPRLAV